MEVFYCHISRMFFLKYVLKFIIKSINLDKKFYCVYIKYSVDLISRF